VYRIEQRKILNLQSVEIEETKKQWWISMTENKVIGYMDFFGKVNALVVKNGKVELQETEIKKSECCWID
jgi:hypothetical protein